MRQLTAYASYLDNLGAPLVGRARFYNLDDSPAVVYGLDNAHEHYIQIGQMVYTNSSGQLVPQVFLDDHDYLVVFDKYIGGGTMAEDDDPESWQEMGSAVDKYNTVGISLDGAALRTANTISDLRVLTPANYPSDTKEIVTLLGYNTKGDKPEINYIWNAYSTATDNGGSIIKVEGIAVGRWVLQECPRYLDVRHFGAFPMTTSSADTTQRYSIQLAGAYARVNDCGLYFYGDSTNAYYDITGLELYDVDSNELARIFAVQEEHDTAASIKAIIHGVKNILCSSSSAISDQGTIEIIGDVLKTSYAPAYSAMLEPECLLIIDSPFQTSYKTFYNIIVKCYTNISSDPFWSFNNCIVLYSNSRNDIECGGMNAETVSTSGDIVVGGKLGLAPYTIEHASGTPDSILLKRGSTTLFKFEDGFAKFVNTLGLPNGWQIDNDNFIMQPDGENEMYISLKMKALLDITSKSGTNAGIQFNRMKVTNQADIKMLKTDSIQPSSNNSISMSNGIRRVYNEYEWTLNGWGHHDITLIANFSSYSKFNVVMAWAWGDTDSSKISDFTYLEGSGGKQNLDIICIENCGPRSPNYEPSSLARDGDFETIIEQSGPLYILGGPESGYTNKIIDVIPPFTRKYFMWVENDGTWYPVSV